MVAALQHDEGYLFVGVPSLINFPFSALPRTLSWLNLFTRKKKETASTDGPLETETAAAAAVGQETGGTEGGATAGIGTEEAVVAAGVVLAPTPATVPLGMTGEGQQAVRESEAAISQQNVPQFLNRTL